MGFFYVLTPLDQGMRRYLATHDSGWVWEGVLDEVSV